MLPNSIFAFHIFITLLVGLVVERLKTIYFISLDTEDI